MRRALPVLIGLLMLSSAALSEQFYKWKDEKGVWHYSAKAPKDQPVDKLTVRSAGARDAVKPDDEDEAADNATASKGDSTDSPNCTAARANLRILNSNPQVAKDLDGDGEIETLTFDQHKEEIALAEQQIAAFCKAAPPAEPETEDEAK